MAMGPADPNAVTIPCAIIAVMPVLFSAVAIGIMNQGTMNSSLIILGEPLPSLMVSATACRNLSGVLAWIRTPSSG